MASIGMSVPGATDLGLGSTLADQVGAETDEQRRKRMLQQQQQKILPGATGASSLMAPTGYSVAAPFS